MTRVLLAAVACVLLAACSSDVTPVRGCAAEAGLDPDCRFQNPEDIVRVPDSDWLLVSQFGGVEGERPGSIAAYQPATGRLEELFPVAAYDDDRRWGDPACAPVPVAAFSPHGIDLDVHPSGRPVLLVVNHGVRESIEFLELEVGNEGLALFWRGCVAAPGDAAFNDVVARSDGGFWATNMRPKSSPTLAALEGGILGLDTGFVYEWSPASGYRVVPGTRAPFPNGIEKSPDERFLYVASSFGNEVRKIELATANTVVRRAVESPDNLSWAEDGRLLVAAHTDSLREFLACRNVTKGACGSAFEILALDADTLEGFAWLAHRGAPMGAATVAVQLGDSLYLGTFAGDRITRWRIPHLE